MQQTMQHNLGFMRDLNEGSLARTFNQHIPWKRHVCSWRVTHIYKIRGEELELQSTDDQQPLIARQEGDNEGRRELGLTKELVL